MMHVDRSASSFVFLQTEVDQPCRCGLAGLSEPCMICGLRVCKDCATFVDPKTRQSTRPSLLLAQRVRSGFLAHQACAPDQRAVPCIYNQDIPLMIQILQGGIGIGRALSS